MLVLAIGALAMAGCSCGIDAGNLGAIACDSASDCLDDEVCEGGYCQYEGAGGDGDSDADVDADADGDGDGDADGDGDRCPRTEVLCGGDCFDLSSSEAHCGRCERSCDGDQTCVDGQCEGSGCDPGLVYCDVDQSCADLMNDDDHCGDCDNACRGGSSCEDGACVCPAGQTDCDAGLSADCRVIDAGDPLNCGGCGVTCQADEFCDSGSCACRPGLTDECGGGCVSLATDPANCGECDRTCGDFCQAGQCVGDCSDGRSECDGICTDTDSDPLNCGDCGDVCAVDRVCIDGECRRFEVPIACDSCPCDGCSEDFDRCCTYPGGAIPICVNAESCS